MYRRLPDNIGIYREELLFESPDTLAWASRIPKLKPDVAEVIHKGGVADPNGYRVIWFVFRGEWFDVGRFHDSKERFLGYYCDIIEPIQIFGPKRVEATDLFLDLWVNPDGSTWRLDEPEFHEAVKNGVISAGLAQRATEGLEKLELDVAAGRFPPEPMLKAKLPRWAGKNSTS